MDPRYSDGPSEEVIWKYSPEKIDEQLLQRYEDDENDDEYRDEVPVNQSSTPLINDRFKNLIDFENMNQGIVNRKSAKLQCSSPIKRKSTDENPTRDIDEIINDLEEMKQLIPSSPIYPEPVIVVDEIDDTNSNDDLEMLKNEVNDDKSNQDEDDSLIDILTQRFAKPTITKVSDESDESDEFDGSDNSLLELLDDRQKPQTRKIERIEISIEENCDDVIAKYGALAKLSFPQRGFQRLCIYDIKEMEVPQQIILTCIDSDCNKVNLILRDPWIRFKYENGMIIHIIEGENFPNKRLFSNDKDPNSGLENDNLIIAYPDVLLSATAIGTAMDCERRAVLSSKFNEPGEYAIAATLGNIIHELIQELLRLKLVEPNQYISKGIVTEVLDKIIEPFYLPILMCHETTESVKKTIIEEHLPFIIEFINIYVTKDNSRSWIHVIGSKSKRKLSVSQIIDIEENIWSSKYGLKGFIDVTVESNVDSDGKKFVSPIEIKTGKWKSNAHEAQGLIYTLLLQDRYDIPIYYHMMLYTKLREFSLQPKVLISMKHLLILRNRLAKYLNVMNEELNDWPGAANELPPMIQNSKCDQCYMKQTCMILNKLNINEQPPGILKHDYEDITKHLKSEEKLELYRSFYGKYDQLLLMEETSITSLTKQTFLTTSIDKEQDAGNCLGRLIIESEDEQNGFKYKFVRAIKQSTVSNSSNEISSLSMLSSNIKKRDYVMISDEYGHLAIGSGYVVDIDDDFVIVHCKRNIRSNNVHKEQFDRSTRQVIRSVLQKSESPIPVVPASDTNAMRYRIDKNGTSIGLQLARYNLLNLFLPEVDPFLTCFNSKKEEIQVKKSQGGYAKGRKLIVEMVEPRWSTNLKKYERMLESIKSANFNEQQRRAIERSLSCKDYNLILGMPGTGKTTVICELIRILVSDGKSVLLTSYTNSAVDNVMTKLSKILPAKSMVRLGSPHRVHETVKNFCIDTHDLDDKTEINDLIDVPQVVAVTCLGINDPWLQIRTKDFDYVILDEASQVSLPVALGPLRFGNKFVLVGDHHQLPPLIQNDFARENGLQESIFEKLCKKYPQSIAELRLQYRMNKEIMSLSNTLTYNGKLTCGDELTANQRLKMAATPTHEEPWLTKATDPSKPVVVLDYDLWKTQQNYSSMIVRRFGALYETSDHGQLKNIGEATIVTDLVRSLKAHGIQNEQIGIMTIYKGQMTLLRELLRHEDIETLTADQFQGRDKDCIILSMVKSNSSNEPGQLLKDLRRINVAMSRAKSKLIIVCSWKCISSVPVLQGFAAHVQANHWLQSEPCTSP